MTKPEAGSAPLEPVRKEEDAWWTVLVVDHFAMGLLRLVRPFQAITPTRLTVGAHVLGVVSAALFLSGELLAAAIVFEVRFVLDCTDGKLARVRGTGSSAGRYIDHLGDVIFVGLNVTAMAVYLAWEDILPLAVAMVLPAIYFAHVCTGYARLTEARLSGVGSRRFEPKEPLGFRRWMADRRLRVLPSRPDAEHLLLFLAPIAAVALAVDWPLGVAAGYCIVYFAYRMVRTAAAGYLIAAAADRGEGS